MFTFGNIISLLVPIIIILVLRYLDRDNRSLEKIKRFTDKLMAEIDEYAAKREKDIKTYASELDAYKMSAKEVLRQVVETQKNLEDKTTAMGMIAQRISEYDKALAELKEMSSRVDENLEIIHNESAFVDKIAQTLKANRQEMENLTQALPKIRADAEQSVRLSAENYIGEFRTILAEMQDQASRAMAGYKEQLLEAEELAESKKADIIKQLDGAFEKAQKTAKTLEHESFEQLKGFIADRGKTLHDEFEQTSQTLEREITRETENLANGLAIAHDKLENELATRSGKLENTIEERFGQLKDQVKDKILEMQTSLKNAKAEWIKESESLVASLRTSVMTAQTDLLAAYSQTDARVNKTEEALNERIQKLDTKAMETLQALQSKIKDQLKAYQDELVAKQQEYKDTVKTALNSLKQETDGARTELTETEKTVMTQVHQLEAKLVGGFEKRVDEGRLHLEQAFAAIEASKIDIRRMEQGLKESMQAVQKRCTEEFTEFTTSIRAQEADFARSVEEEITKLQTAMASLDEELTKLKDHAYENVSEKMKVFEDDFFLDIKKRSDEIDARLSDWRMTYEQRLEAELAKTGEVRNATEQRWISDANERAKAIQGKIQDVFEKISANVEKYKTAVSQETQATQEQLKILHATTTREIAEVKKETETETKTIQSDITTLSKSVAMLDKELRQKSAEALAEFSKTYETLRDDSGKRSREIMETLDAAIRQYQTQAREFEERFTLTTGHLNTELSEEQKKQEKLFADFDRQFKIFEKESRIFERADELREKLAQAISTMKEDLALINSRQAEIDELDTQYARIKKTEEELKDKISKFLAEKRRLDSMEQDFDKLLSISQQIDQKLSQVTSSNDQLTEIQVELKKLNELADEAGKKYERLEKKNTVIESTSDTVEKNFQAVNTLEQTLIHLQEDINAIPNQIIDIKRSLSEVEELEPRLDTVIDKYSTIDSVLADAEKRIDNLQKVREWLVRAETRFEDLNKKAGENLKLLRDVLKKEPGTGDTSSAPPLSVQDSVRKLAHQGWKTDEIAKALKLSRGEVELILELPYER